MSTVQAGSTMQCLQDMPVFVVEPYPEVTRPLYDVQRAHNEGLQGTHGGTGTHCIQDCRAGGSNNNQYIEY